MNDTERLVAAVEELTEAVELLARRIGPVTLHESVEDNLNNQNKEQEASTAEVSPEKMLITHMESHGVNTQKVDVTTEGFDSKVYFKEVFKEMTDEETEAFREYTMEMDFVDVHKWIETNGNTFPDGFTVDVEDLDGLV